MQEDDNHQSVGQLWTGSEGSVGHDGQDGYFESAGNFGSVGSLGKESWTGQPGYLPKLDVGQLLCAEAVMTIVIDIASVAKNFFIRVEFNVIIIVYFPLLGFDAAKLRRKKY